VSANAQDDAAISMTARNGNSAALSVLVKKAPTQVLLDQTGLTLDAKDNVVLKVGSTLNLSARVLYDVNKLKSDEYASYSLRFSSSSSARAKIQRNAKGDYELLGVRKGMVNVQLRTFNNKFYRMNVSIVE
ncbi:MAG: hypothetical protein RR367_11160, partial [Clostridia bacterium]